MYSEETGETEEDWEVEFREEEDRERGGMPDKIEYRRDMAEVWGEHELMCHFLLH